MKKLFLLLPLVLFLIPLPIRAACVNNVNTETGVTCITVTPNKTVTQSITGFCDGVRCNYIPLEQLPGADPKKPVNFPDYLNNVFRVLIVLGGMFAVATFVYGGVMYMVSDIVDKKGFARAQMQRAVYGILLLLGSYLLLTTINPNLGFLKLSPESIGKDTSGAPVQGSTVFQGKPPTDLERKNCEQGSSEGAPGTIHFTPTGWQCVPR